MNTVGWSLVTFMLGLLVGIFLGTQKILIEYGFADEEVVEKEGEK